MSYTSSKVDAFRASKDSARPSNGPPGMDSGAVFIARNSVSNVNGGYDSGYTGTAARPGSMAAPAQPAGRSTAVNNSYTTNDTNSRSSNSIGTNAGSNGGIDGDTGSAGGGSALSACIDISMSQLDRLDEQLGALDEEGECTGYRTGHIIGWSVRLHACYGVLICAALINLDSCLLRRSAVRTEVAAVPRSESGPGSGPGYRGQQVHRLCCR